MSDDAKAATPPDAPAPQPNESVYQALNAALSATSRGRWFLSEFAKRNRNSESSKMLDAVARIGQAVADPALAAASTDLFIVRDWAKTARDDAAKQMHTPEHDSAQAAMQRGARIIREIATSMRAVGNDPRICNMLDTQLDAIEAARQAQDAAATAPIAAFDRLIARIDELIPAPSPAAATGRAAMPADDQDARLAAVTDLAVACASGDPDIATAQDAEDEDILARIAMEMASPDDEEGEPSMMAEPMSPAHDSNEIDEGDPEPPAALALEAKLEAAPEHETKPEPSPEPQAVQLAAQEASGLADGSEDRPAVAEGGLSLGESVLAQGLVQPPPRPLRDPFTALKRLTQAEKIALFT